MQRNAMPPEEDEAMATGDKHKKLVKIGQVIPEICSHTDTHTQTDHSTPLRYWGGVITEVSQ